MHRLVSLAAVFSGLVLSGCGSGAPSYEELDAANPVLEIPGIMLGHSMSLAEIDDPPTPAKVRLGRFLYYDTRLSADNTISCATCHRPENGFSEPTAVSTGIEGQTGNRKSPTFINAAFAIYPETFWDGRAGSLEEQAKGPVENPIEMGNTHAAAAKAIADVPGYAAFFEEAFGDSGVTIDRIADAIADYERTRISGNSRYDQWLDLDEEEPGYVDPMTAEEHLGRELFFGKALCATCHVGEHFSDSRFHNLGIGFDTETGELADVGRFDVTAADADKGAFKTPGLREVHLRAPYMHDGSLATLRDVMDHYVEGGTPNPSLSPKMKALDMTEAEIEAVIAFMEALAGEGWQDTPPAIFPG